MVNSWLGRGYIFVQMTDKPEMTEQPPVSLRVSIPHEEHQTVKSLVASEYDDDDDGDDASSWHSVDSKATPAKKWQDTVFYIHKCENHRHRTSRDQIRQCQRNKGGCRFSMFSKRPTSNNNDDIVDQTNQAPSYPPRLRRLLHAFRSR